MAKPTTLQLRVYHGKRLSYDENGNVLNENYKVALRIPDESKRFMENMRYIGWCKIEVEKLFEGEKELNDEKELNKYKLMVQEALKPVKESAPDYKSMYEEMAKRLEALEANSVKKVESTDEAKKPGRKPTK